MGCFILFLGWIIFKVNWLLFWASSCRIWAEYFNLLHFHTHSLLAAISSHFCFVHNLSSWTSIDSIFFYCDHFFYALLMNSLFFFFFVNIHSDQNNLFLFLFVYTCFLYKSSHSRTWEINSAFNRKWNQNHSRT